MLQFAQVVEQHKGKTRKTVMGYYWGRIAEAWAVWPGTNLREFCRAYHIPFQKAAVRPEMEYKLKVHRSREFARTRTELVLREMRVELVRDAESEGRQLAKTLDAVQQIGGLGVNFALARLAKFSGDGIVPVTAIPSAEVRRCVEIAWKATEMLRTALELRRATADSTASDAARSEPRIKEVATRSTIPESKIVPEPGPAPGSNGTAHP